ncbi:hypothetical protein PRIPAC_91610 [Pristionchus pacificus]|nr:hypothetical protein PRIPAC_91610 [Pristionchus pacificus]
MSLPLSQLVFESDLLVEDGAFELIDTSGVDGQPMTSSFQSIPEPGASLMIQHPVDDFPSTSIDDWLQNTGPLDAFDDHRYGPSDTDFDRFVNSNHDYYDKVPQSDFDNDQAEHSYAHYLPPLHYSTGFAESSCVPMTNGGSSSSSSTTMSASPAAATSPNASTDIAFPTEYGLEEIVCKWTMENGVQCTYRDARCRMEAHVSSTHIGRGIKNPVCRWDNCMKSFVRRYLMLRHVRCLHCDDKPYECSECGQRFSLRERMKLHQRVAHGLHPQLKLPKNYQQRMQQIDESSGLQRQSTTYNCKECNESFPTTSHRRHHVERIHQSQLIYVIQLSYIFKKLSS